MMLQVTPFGSSSGRRNKFMNSQTCILKSFYIENLLDTTNAPARLDAEKENPPKFQFFSAHNDVEDECLLSLKILGNRNHLLRSWVHCHHNQPVKINLS